MPLDDSLESLDMPPDYAVENEGKSRLENIRAGKVLPREFYYDEVSSASVCHVLQVQDEIAYIHWITMPGESSRFFNLRDRSAEISCNTTLPGFRKKGIASLMTLHAAHELRRMGMDNFYAAPHSENIASIKALKRAGFREIGRLTAIGPFNRRFKV
jgi:ribosomal protein S18 acetylase RimI-like enzyme